MKKDYTKERIEYWENKKRKTKIIEVKEHCEIQIRKLKDLSQTNSKSK